MKLVSRARMFAITMHCDQVRKWTGEPYIRHPEAVAELVEEVGGTPEMIAAAWLHDTVEDTPVTIAQIYAEFGPDVAEYVRQLTKPVVARSAEAITIKLADIIDNTETIIERAPAGEARAYLNKKLAQVESYRKGNRVLMEFALRQINDGLRRLGE